MTKRNLIISGGIRHDFEHNSIALANQLSLIGFDSSIETDMEIALNRLSGNEFDLLTIMALRWPMNNDPKYLEYKNKWGLTLSNTMKNSLENFISDGGGMFGFHTACICFDDWSEWIEILGGKWKWGSSFHPPLGLVSVHSTNEKHYITEGIETFDIVDEVYSNLLISPNIHPLLMARPHNSKISEPILWVNNYGKGKVVFDGLGHNKESINDINHSEIIKRCVKWATNN